MTDTYKTQCPNCHAVYKIGIEQLAKGYKQARCKRCKHQFVMRDNLVTESLITKPKNQPNKDNLTEKIADLNKATTRAANGATSKDTVTIKPANNSQSPAASDDLIHDDMIHDNMAEFDETDNVEDFKELQNEWSEESLMQAALNADNKDTSTFFDESEEDETWLEALLEDDAKSVSQPVHSKSKDLGNDETLNDLLDELGVDTAAVDMPDHEQAIERMQQRMQKQTVGTKGRDNKKSPIAILLWALGCLGLILLLPAQYVWFNMDNLVKDPASQAQVQAFCDVLSCTIPGSDLSKFVIPDQKIKANSANPNQSDIVATLVNTSEQSQLYPSLKVVIHDDSKIIGDFVAQPRDYLTVPQRMMNGKKIELFMLSVNIPVQNIHHVEITPLY